MCRLEAPKSGEELYRRFVLDVYREIADHFDVTRRWPWPETRWFEGLLPRGSRVLEVGCGSGRNLLFLAERGHRVVGLDPVDELLTLAEENIGKARVWDRVELVGGDVRSLPFEDGTFDGVLCIAVLHHLPSREERLLGLRECLRVLAPRGVGLVSVWAREQDMQKERPR
ncbi:MAG: class I SAM-dependent methyltransferase, partial [Thermoplasmata archaeon]|nr:class I SAM-dependent methyltransferase [Thermoplasmata archaeon]